MKVYVTAMLVLLASTLTELSCFPLFKQDPFDKLNSYLMEHEKSDSLDSNIDAAKQILDKPEPVDPKLIELTRHFVDMVRPGRACDLETLEPISVAFQSMKKYVKDPLKDQRRLSKLIVNFAASRSSCLEDLAEYHWKYDDSWTVSKMTKHLTASGRYKFRFTELDDAVTALKLQRRSLNTLFTPFEVYSAIVDLGGSDMLLNKVDRQEIESLLDGSLYRQCQHGKGQLRILDTAVAILSSVEPSIELTPRMPKQMSILLKSLANYLTCKRLEVTNKEKLIDSVFWWFKNNQKNLKHKS